MPQKRNPDAAELVRGHAGRVIGCTTALMVTMKGLPLAYSKDMQDDKPPVFEAAGLLALSIAATTGMVADSTFDTDRLRAAAEGGVRDVQPAKDEQLSNLRGVAEFERLAKELLPKILITDPAVQAIKESTELEADDLPAGWLANRVLRIVRHSPSAGSSTAYRLIVESA